MVSYYLKIASIIKSHGFFGGSKLLFLSLKRKKQKTSFAKKFVEFQLIMNRIKENGKKNLVIVTANTEIENFVLNKMIDKGSAVLLVDSSKATPKNFYLKNKYIYIISDFILEYSEASSLFEDFENKVLLILNGTKMSTKKISNLRSFGFSLLYYVGFVSSNNKFLDERLILTADKTICTSLEVYNCLLRFRLDSLLLEINTLSELMLTMQNSNQFKRLYS